jgi:hypothetical protein
MTTTRITNSTHDTTADPPSEHRPLRPKGPNQSQIETQNHPEIKSQIKIKSSTHLGITISWGGPAAVASGPESAGGARC